MIRPNNFALMGIMKAIQNEIYVTNFMMGRGFSQLNES